MRILIIVLAILLAILLTLGLLNGYWPAHAGGCVQLDKQNIYGHKVLALYQCGDWKVMEKTHDGLNDSRTIVAISPLFFSTQDPSINLRSGGCGLPALQFSTGTKVSTAKGDEVDIQVKIDNKPHLYLKGKMWRNAYRFGDLHKDENYHKLHNDMIQGNNMTIRIRSETGDLDETNKPLSLIGYTDAYRLMLSLCGHN